ncbi:response regulator [Clostridium folliculivorans]|uniref:Stage 0 sporulation protein A homolog n=1 Tax=Clostridium folliculivorans TaxID=2886038 RepID=A0A9W5XYB3_9CLOT|nr:response regulator [Clostridium folliculivorans]GKU23182.1 response regulator [Clostridium folliculivorans]GKU29228.1 response regulator [Clostridium folliculivorans]
MFKILVVDDERYSRKLLREIIEEFIDDVFIFEACDVKEAIELIENNTPDLLITDYKLGGSNGIDICKIIKTDRKYEHIKTILLTGIMYEDIKADSWCLDSYIAKPYDEDNLINVINTLRDVRG